MNKIITIASYVDTHQEEIDLALRPYQSGWKIVSVSTYVVPDVCDVRDPHNYKQKGIAQHTVVALRKKWW